MGGGWVPLDGAVFFGVDEIQDVDERGAVWVLVFVVVVGRFVVVVIGGRRVVSRVQAILLAPAPSPGLSLLVVEGGVLVQEEDGPVGLARVGLVGQHELSQGGLVAADGGRVLVLHDGAAVNVE